MNAISNTACNTADSTGYLDAFCTSSAIGNETIDSSSSGITGSSAIANGMRIQYPAPNMLP